LIVISEGIHDLLHSSLLISVTKLEIFQYFSVNSGDFDHSITGFCQFLFSGLNELNSTRVTVFIAASGVFSVIFQLHNISTFIDLKLLS